MSKQLLASSFHVSKKKRRALIDRAAIVASFLYPLTGVPQVIEVFGGNIAGVSILSWAGFSLFSVFFVLYGLMHKVRPMIISNTIWFIVDILIIVGVLVHRF